MSPYNITEYITKIDEVGKPTNKIIPGQFYSFAYDYYLNPDIKKLPKAILDYYDTLPLVYVFNIKTSKNGSVHYECLNMHHMPIKSRKIWLSKLSKVAGIFIENEMPVLLPAALMKTLMIKSKFGQRQYNINRIKYIKKIPFAEIKNIIKYAAPTYDAVQYQEVASKYSLYNPYTTKRKG